MKKALLAGATVTLALIAWLVVSTRPERLESAKGGGLTPAAEDRSSDPLPPRAAATVAAAPAVIAPVTSASAKSLSGDIHFEARLARPTLRPEYPIEVILTAKKQDAPVALVRPGEVVVEYPSGRAAKFPLIGYGDGLYKALVRPAAPEDQGAVRMNVIVPEPGEDIHTAHYTALFLTANNSIGAWVTAIARQPGNQASIQMQVKAHQVHSISIKATLVVDGELAGTVSSGPVPAPDGTGTIALSLPSPIPAAAVRPALTDITLTCDDNQPCDRVPLLYIDATPRP